MDLISPMVTAELQLDGAEVMAYSAQPMGTPMVEAGLEKRLLRSSVTRIQLQRLAMRGMHATEAAKVLGIHPHTARSHYSDPDFRKAVIAKVDGAFGSTDAAFLERTKSMTERLEEQATKSFEALQLMLDPDSNDGMKISDNLKFRIHTQFLDRHTESAPVSKQMIKIDPISLSLAARAASEMDNNVVPITQGQKRIGA